MFIINYSLQIDNIYANLQNYTGVQVLRAWTDAPPPASAEETGETSRRKRSSSTYLETEIMFNNETLLKSIIDGHKKSELVINETITEVYSLAESDYIPKPSGPTVCSSDIVKNLVYPEHLGIKQI